MCFKAKYKSDISIQSFMFLENVCFLTSLCSFYDFFPQGTLAKAVLSYYLSFLTLAQFEVDIKLSCHLKIHKSFRNAESFPSQSCILLSQNVKIFRKYYIFSRSF